MRPPHPAGSKPYEYVLGDSRREGERLEEQARLWDPVAIRMFDRIGIAPGWKVLEVGPGRGSVHRELRRRVRGPIDAVERSAAFAASLATRSDDDGFGAGRIWQTDLIDAELPVDAYDLIYARWVFCFLPDPDAHVEKLARALKPGGLLAIQDYVHRESYALFPRPAEWLDFLAADRALFASQGGDNSVAGRLPSLFLRAGIEVIDATPVLMSGSPGSPVWSWLRGYFDAVRGQLARTPPLDEAKVSRLHEQWRAAEEDRNAFVLAPAMLDLVGRK